MVSLFPIQRRFQMFSTSISLFSTKHFPDFRKNRSTEIELEFCLTFLLEVKAAYIFETIRMCGLENSYCLSFLDIFTFYSQDLKLRSENYFLLQTTTKYTRIDRHFYADHFLSKHHDLNSHCFRTMLLSFIITSSNCHVRSFFWLFNPLMHNVPKWSDTLQKSCSKCCKLFKVCLTILGHYALKG